MTVLVTNENGEPLSDVVVTTSTPNYTETTGSNGTVTIENVPGGLCKVVFKTSGCADFSRQVLIESEETVEIHLIIFSELTVLLKDNFDHPITNTEIITYPETQTVISDESGKAVLQNIPAQSYVFTITRPGLSPAKKTVNITDKTFKEIEVSISSQLPNIKIITPANNTLLSAYDVCFECTGTDYEDGVLQDNQLFWSSDIDGVLGTGSSISVDRLSVGNHRIELSGTDCDGQTGRAYVNISVMSYNPKSYFPLMNTMTSEFRHLNPDFFVINKNNVSELWQIQNLTIHIEDDNKRITTVLYDRTVGFVIMHSKYIITDYLFTEDDAVYVTRTSEELYEWKTADEEKHPNSVIKIETSYSPYLLILNNVADPKTDSRFESAVKIETEWYYIYYDEPSAVFHESKNITIVTEFGEMRHIQTDKGIFEAIEVMINQDEIKKRWYLTKGLGIIRFDYYISEIEQNAILKDSDMLEYYQRSHPSKIIPGNSENYEMNPHLRNYNITSGNDTRIPERRNILRGMLP
ncbi:MAG: carboxypeptidase regulatory-like domain-containing protein [Candidatus Latescibacteria bacterium]|nr:carboxypeptidase regulatory-like domain-containing protein [Candidatus Latescibacterota bacterium]